MWLFGKKKKENAQGNKGSEAIKPVSSRQGAQPDLSKYRGNTPEDDKKIISSIKIHRQRVTIDERNRVWTHGGVYIADVHQITPNEESLEMLLNQ